MRRLLLLALAALAILPLAAHAQTAGTCATGSATADLSAAGVRARVYNTGALFWKGAGNVYNVPRAPDGAAITPNAIFAASLWVGGYVGTDLRMAAADYGTYELWPGPLTPAGELPNATDCTPYDRIFRVSRADVAAYNATATATPDLRDWPAAWGAPVIDGDGTAGNYNLAGGDRPEILGTETAWWVMNDVGGTKRTTATRPMGLEVRVAAFAMSSADAAIDRATLYRYTFVYRGTAPLTDTYIGFWTDTDLGNAADDFVGTDSLRQLVYTYNADNLDDGSDGYGTPPPAIGLRLVEGPLVAAPGQTWTDPDGTTYPDRRRLSLSGGVESGKGGGDRGDPRDGTADWYRYLTGRWPDDSQVRACGNGMATARPECPPTRWMYPGDPVTRQGWSERNLYPMDATPTAGFPSDKRFIGIIGPFTMQPGETHTVTTAYVYARGTSNLNSVTELRSAADRVQTAWSSGAFRAGFSGETPTVITIAPLLRSPAIGATGQPLGATRLVWGSVGADLSYEVQISTDPAFPPDATRTHVAPSLSILDESTAPASGPSYWRVRGMTSTSTPTSIGPWSETGSYTTEARFVAAPTLERDFLTTANAAGPLAPPDMGAFAFNGSGFPQLAGLADRPTARQQSTVNLNGSAGWGIHTFGARTTYAEWLARTTREGVNTAEIGINSFEWRFTGTSLAERAYDTDAATVGATMTVPFEIWSLGTDLASAADDVRMIPLVCESVCGTGTAQGVFDIGGDSPLSGGTDDPVTDAVHWHVPTNRAPGQSGYAAWADARQRGDASASGLVGAEVWARIVLMGWNMGTPATTYRMVLPERGTVFQMRTTATAGTPPLLAAPAHDRPVPGTQVAFFWNSEPLARVEFQLSTDALFATLLRHDTLDVDASVEPHVVVGLAAGQRHHWRVRHLPSASFSPQPPWSTVWTFVPGVSSSLAAGDVPAALSLSAVYPNPSRGTARVRVGMPASGGTARVEVFDVLGRRVAVAHDGVLAPGWSDVALETGAWAPGVYVVRLTRGREARTQTVVVAR